jgi:YbbR domain-containing protein
MIYHPFRNFGLKLLSVGIAILLWLTVAGEQVVERTVLIPLELVNTPPGLELIENPPATVSVRIRGASSTLSEIDRGAVVAQLDVRDARPRRQFYGHLSPADVRVPFGVEVLQVSPGMVPLRLDQTVSKPVKVRVRYEGRPAEGYVVGRVSSVPDTVTIEGPASVVASIEEAETEAIAVHESAARLTETVSVRVNDPLVRLRPPQVARVTIEVNPEPRERTLAGVPVGVRNGRAKTTSSLDPAVVSVEVRGDPAVVEALTAASLLAWADLAGRAPGRYNLPVLVDVPPGVELVRTIPARVSIRVR